ncbi:sigma-70 family RNA polymerase sigma factor [Merismopedia glauca]|uniref:RNA polymerase subunit sigma n=1 Tax=Merismopedia glauca CCAP 1448/3 TaxID=1296344 RepID=A0A2T1C4R1_9CYAN|nr:sigma-70 family RNA polymerase sigma factor [Merismopedia glauca]PSB03270.1 RNA polymerase subunit sigma [Merismopedia glauca CCAP 1448/3]
MLSNQTDAELFQALCLGDLSALGKLYDGYGEIVYRMALRMLGNPQEAEDLTQDVFLTLWRNRSYDSKRGSMQVFLTTMTRSKAIDRHRQKRSHLNVLQKWGHNQPLENSTNLMDKISLKEISQRVSEAMSELPDNQRQVLEMAYFEGMSQSEISAGLNLPLGTVKTNKRQGLLRLRQMLQDLVE